MRASGTHVRNFSEKSSACDYSGQSRKTAWSSARPGRTRGGGGEQARGTLGAKRTGLGARLHSPQKHEPRQVPALPAHTAQGGCGGQGAGARGAGVGARCPRVARPLKRDAALSLSSSACHHRCYGGEGESQCGENICRSISGKGKPHIPSGTEGSEATKTLSRLTVPEQGGRRPGRLSVKSFLRTPRRIRIVPSRKKDRKTVYRGRNMGHGKVTARKTSGVSFVPGGLSDTSLGLWRGFFFFLLFKAPLSSDSRSPGQGAGVWGA